MIENGPGEEEDFSLFENMIFLDLDENLKYKITYNTLVFFANSKLEIQNSDKIWLLLRVDRPHLINQQVLKIICNFRDMNQSELRALVSIFLEFD